MMGPLHWIDEGLADPDFCSSPGFAQALAVLRAEDPVHWTTGFGPRPYWSIVSYADCKAVLSDAETLSSRRGGFMPLTAEEPSVDQARATGVGFIPTHVDPPEHMRIRRPLAPSFGPTAAAGYRQLIDETVAEIMADILPRGECDLVTDVAAELPARFVCRLLGVPEADRPRIAHLARGVMGSQDPTYLIDGSPLRTRQHYQGELFRYALAHTTARRGGAGADLATLLANSLAEDGEPLSDLHLGWWTFALFIGGLETTRSVISLGTKALLDHPGLMEQLRQDGSAVPLAVEELLRWVTPSRQKFRIATRDTQLGTAQIRAGDWVVCWLSSANHDPAQFDRPDVLDPARKPNLHLSFGIGEHRCLGQSIARLELQSMFRAILDDLEDLALAGPCRPEPSTFANSLASMPVRFRPRG